MTDAKPRGPKVRLFVEGDLALGATVGLTPGQAHYLKHVMRMEAGAELALFNGRDGEWLGRIDGLGRGWASVSLVEQRREQAQERDLWLVFAPIKRARIDFLAEKATELGVRALWPVFTRHSVITRVNTERLRANAVEAAEQSERLTVPEVFEPVTFDELVARWPRQRRLVVCDESGAAAPIAEVLGGMRGAEGEGWALLTGPEGGLARSELDALGELPFVTKVGLGPRILRADTAAVAALACWQALLGDWRGAPHAGTAATSE
jgi:16S rRNA (uracil1498-N3)-methyltransferase